MDENDTGKVELSTEKPATPSPYLVPLRLVAVGALRIISMGLAAMADKIESEKD